MSNMELKVLELIEGKVAINYEQLKEELKANLEKYKGFQVTEENMAESKRIRAKLNNLAKAIDDRKREIKRQYLEPYIVFEAQAKELIGIINEVNSEIDNGIKSNETAEKEAKKQAIFELWREFDFKLISLSDIWEEQWLNKGCPLGVVKVSIENKIKEVKANIELLKTLFPNEEDLSNVTVKYLTNHLDFKGAIDSFNKVVIGIGYNAEKKARELVGVVSTTTTSAKPTANDELVEIKLTLCLYESQVLGLQKYLNDNNIIIK